MIFAGDPSTIDTVDMKKCYDTTVCDLMYELVRSLVSHDFLLSVCAGNRDRPLLPSPKPLALYHVLLLAGRVFLCV